MSDSLKIQERARSDGSVTLSLHGELDMCTTLLLAARLARAAEENHAVTLDLHGLGFIDAAGLRCLLDAAASARRDGYALSITRSSRSARGMFDLTDAGRFLPLEDERL